MTKSIVENVDWDLYQKSVLLVIQGAVRRYSALHTSGNSEPGSGNDAPVVSDYGAVYQIGIWTYWQTAYTGICFETKSHAKQSNSEREIRFRRSGLEEMAQKTAPLEYNTSPSDFLYNNFSLYGHPELLPITEIDRFDDAQNYEAQRKIEAALLETVQQAIKAKLFDALPREDHVWIGINSICNFYDHIVKY